MKEMTIAQGLNMKKYVYYIFASIAIFTLIMTGCGGTASDVAKINSADYISEDVIPVNPDGSIEKYTQHGISIKAERNTFDPNVSVKLTENKVFEGIDGKFSSISSLYTISAEKVQTTSIGENKTKVTSVANPVTLTIQNKAGIPGTYYIGTRATFNSPWSYTLINEKNSQDNPLPVFSRYSVDNNAPEYFFSTYNIDFQFSLFIEDPGKKEDDDKSKTVITDFKLEAEPSEYKLVNSRYNKDITVKATIYGDNINNLTSSNYVVKIGFLNDQSMAYGPNTFPITGATAVYDVSEPDAGAGNKYKHTITLSNISDYSSNTLSFGISASKLTQQVFPDNFTVTVKVDGTSKILAYENTKGITLINKTPVPVPVVATASMILPASTNAGVSTNIIIAFSENINWEPESKSLVTLYHGETPIECDYLFYTANNTLTLTPAAKLLLNNKYTVNVSKLLTNAETDQQFEFTTVESEDIPSITPDISKSSDGKYYLVADQKFYIDFNRIILDEKAAKSNIYMQKNNADFKDFTVKFDKEMKVAAVNVDVPFEADMTYTLGVKEFSDSDGTILRAVESSFTALSQISLKNVELAGNDGWQTASGSLDVPTSGKIRVTMNQSIEPSGVKFIDENGSEINEPFVVNKTTEKSSIIEFDYTGLNGLSTYGVKVSFSDTTTGQSMESDAHTFVTTMPDVLILADPSKPNSENNPYLVYGPKPLDQIREEEYLAKGYYFKQMVDIDLSPSAYQSDNNTATNGWKPFGRNAYASDRIAFKGHYDGNNKTISNMTIEYYEDEDESLSLFGVIQEGSVTNLTMENVSIKGLYNLGAIAGYVFDATITNCRSTGNIEGYYYETGGLFGYCENITANDCHSEVNVTFPTDVDNTSYSIAGGLAGYVDYGEFTNCDATGEIKGLSTVGGLISSIYEGTIDGCYTINQKITSSGFAGGLVGKSNGSSVIIQNSHCDNVTLSVYDNSSNDIVGGIIGSNLGSVINCYSSGTVTGHECVGGIIGINGNSAISGDYAIAKGLKSECNVIGYDYMGGIIGVNDYGEYENLEYTGPGPTAADPAHTPEHSGPFVGLDNTEI